MNKIQKKKGDTIYINDEIASAAKINTYFLSAP